jgi:lysophospholipid acyltransferase (LPLAT)-like uncharacterized protein
LEKINDLELSILNLEPAPVPDLRINTLKTSRRLLLLPLWGLMRIWARTLRFECSEETRALLGDTSAPAVLLCWHNRLFLAAEIYQRYRRPRTTYGLVSTSKDGAWLAAFFDLIGLRTVRGSSSRRGREALLDLSARLAEGNDVALTPDGPRGPIYSFKPGAAILVGRSRARVLLFGSGYSAAWRLKSWDAFILPRPFSTVSLSCRLVDGADLPADFQQCAEVLRKALLELNTD